jgi:hypothetical protein
MALYPQLQAIRVRLRQKLTLSTKERALLSELNELDNRLETRVIEEASVRLTKMTGPDDGRCGCCGR